MSAIAEKQTTTTASAPVLEWIDPTTLSVDINVRKDAALTTSFIASIKEHGVLEPVIAHRKDDGTMHVLMGQRRTRAAVEAGRNLIPVMVMDSPEEATRIITQVVENNQRSALTDADEADAYHQLSLIGVTPGQIAKKTGRTKTAVEGALKAKASDAGTAALGKGCTIEEALILAEFEGDTDATEGSESVIADAPEQLAHVAQQLRDRRAQAAALTALIAEIEATGKTIVQDASYYAGEDNIYPTHALRADGQDASEDDANAVIITTDYQGNHRVTAVIAGFEALGFTAKRERYTGETTAAKGPMTDKEKETRRTLIENNKLMVSATTVRQEWVTSMLAKKQAPKGWQYFTLHAITHHAEVASGYDGEVAATMAGAKIEGEKSWAWNPLREHVAKTTTRPEFSLIALICAGYEKTIAKDSWRSPHQSHRDYLNQLVLWGYTASETEQIIIDSNK